MKFKSGILVILTCLALITVVPVSAVPGGIQWQPYEKGISLAKEQGKQVFLYFWADWCGYCAKMEKSTFKDPSVVNYLNDNFIAISVDSERDRKVAANYGVRGLPTTWLLKPDSSKLSSLPGYVDADRLMTILKYIKTESYETMSYKDFIKTL